MYFELKPYKHKFANTEIKARLVSADEKDVVIGDKIHSIFVFKDNNRIISFWKCSNVFARLRFLFSGKINLVMLSQKMTPSVLTIGKEFENE